MKKTLTKNELEHINHSINCEGAILYSDFIYAIICAGRKYYDYRNTEGDLLPGVIEEFETTLESIKNHMDEKLKNK